MRFRRNRRKVKDDYREVARRLRTPRVEVQRGTSGEIVWGLIARRTRARSCSRKNRLIYLWGHLAASSDRLLPLLGIGERLHPEFDAMFISNPDKSVPLTVSEQSLKAAWQEINQKLWEGFSKFSDSDWAQRHTAVSEQDFEKEPHRSRFGVLLGRTAHLAYHLGQAALARPKARGI